MTTPIVTLKLQHHQAMALWNILRKHIAEVCPSCAPEYFEVIFSTDFDLSNQLDAFEEALERAEARQKAKALKAAKPKRARRVKRKQTTKSKGQKHD